MKMPDENAKKPDEIPTLEAVTDSSDDQKKDLLERAIQALRETKSEETVTDAADAPPAETEAREIEPKVTQAPLVPQKPERTLVETPWTLQQFFNGEIDLDVELSSRFQNMPVMSTISFRSLGTKTGRGVAKIGTQDGAAQVVFDADKTSRVVQMSFTFGSMLTLRFALRDLSDVDRERWLELMRREQGGLAFLWGPSRWENDYLICISRKYFTNLYAFSPNNFEAAVRMTPDVTAKLLDWLEDFWTDESGSDEPPELLTW
jgi:hypothetical protein